MRMLVHIRMDAYAWTHIHTNRGVRVKVKFTLNMENLLVNEKHIDRLCISWVNEVTEEEVLSVSGQWINSQNFLTQRMIGLKKVGESSLTIEPIEEPSSN